MSVLVTTSGTDVVLRPLLSRGSEDRRIAMDPHIAQLPIARRRYRQMPGQSAEVPGFRILREVVRTLRNQGREAQ